MKIIDLKEEHPEIYARVLGEQKNQGNEPNDQLGLNYNYDEGNFSWAKTIEGVRFWSSINDENFYVFYEKYPRQTTPKSIIPKTYEDLRVGHPRILSAILAHQMAQGNLFNTNLSVGYGRSVGGFTWSETKEGHDFWSQILSEGKTEVFYEKYPDIPSVEVARRQEALAESAKKIMELKAPLHYDNSKGSLYLVAQQRGWNPYLFDIVKRLERGGKKDPLKQEIEKSIFVLQLWLKEHEEA